MSYLGPASKPIRVVKRLAFRALHCWRAPHHVEARIGNITIVFPSRSKLAEGIYANAWERMERNVLEAVLRPGSTVLDIGANIGFYTCLLAATVGPEGQVVAFEPTPSTLTLLQENLQRNRLSNVQVHEVALSDSSGTAMFNIFPDGADAYNSLGAARAFGTEAATRVTVRTEPLDAYLDTIAPETVSAIKVDVEGAEALVIAGGRELFRRCDRAIVMVELNEAAAQQCGSSISSIVGLLKELGYGGYHLTADSRLAPLDEEHMSQLVAMRAAHYDAFFVQPEGAEILRVAGLLA